MPAAEIDPGLASSVAGVGAGLANCRDPWWVIGSAAMALHGAAVEVRDVDALASRRDAAALLEARALPVRPGREDERFRSEIFGSWESGTRGVEIFAGFHVRTPQGWRELLPQSRVLLRVAGTVVFVPSIAELTAWGRLFARPKDAAREPILRALQG